MQNSLLQIPKIRGKMCLIHQFDSLDDVTAHKTEKTMGGYYAP